jgi:hypothetical protein
MDAASVRKLLCVSRAPLGNAGDVVIQMYKDDTRDFARRSMLHGEVEIVHPPERCKKRVGRGRCRRAVSRGCIIQICASHMETTVSDWNLDSLRQFHTLVPEGNDQRWRQIGMRERSRPPASVQMNDAEFDAGMAMMDEFVATGAHYDDTLRAAFPLFLGAPPPHHPYPEAWAGA